MSPKNEEPRYDNVQIKKIADGTTIEGHDAVKKYVQDEQKMMAEHGASIIFQVYRLNLQASSLEELQGEKLVEIKVDSSFVSKTDTVAAVKNKLRSLLNESAETMDREQAPDALAVNDDDRITLYLSGRPLQDQTAFYDDNYILLPVWIQVLLHRCESEEAVQLINNLQRQR